MDGLAQQMAGPGMGQQMPTVEEIIQLLMEGIDPQELIEMGIPEELLMQALQVLEQSGAQAGGQAPGPAIPMGTPDAGLAQTMVA